MSEKKLTPMMKQYHNMQKEIPDDAILLFRLGDFYEIFFDDAAEAAPILEVALTKRGGVPMCGVPYHAMDNYLPRLLNSGLKVAIAEQVEDPKEARGIVKREISKIITPGTLTESSVLKPDKNNFLAAVSLGKKGILGFAVLDISTADFRITELQSHEELINELHRLGVKECLTAESCLEELQNKNDGVLSENLIWTSIQDWIMAYDTAEELLKRHFNVASLDGFGCRKRKHAVCAAGAVLHYASENLRHSTGHIKSLKFYENSRHMILDYISQRNLELVEPLHSNSSSDSTLLKVLDYTGTPMGSRLLREWILRPLFDKTAILERLDAVDTFFSDPLSMAEIKEIIGTVRDLERITSKLNIGSINPRDFLALQSSLKNIPAIKIILENFDSPLICELCGKLSELPDLCDEIESAINEETPINLNDGGVIKDAYSETLDEYRRASSEGKSWLASIQKKEISRTGIKNLKIKYNKVFGYYLEISKGNLSLVPEDYIRKQTLVNAERFITPELKEIENKILGSEEKAKLLELQLFAKLKDFAKDFTEKIQQNASAIAVLDVIISLSEAASKNNYIRAHISNDEKIKIIGGRHPVLDSVMTEERFVPNNTILDGDENRMIIITGPNMAGKSTYIRQSAMLVLMAQIGSFIPAKSAEIGLVDRIFTRVGAADDISRGQSTFMVEMVETANILHHASSKSLIILDEIGRGTSTFDGLSIAWAVAEYIHDAEKCRARTQFATHYHELTELALTRKGVKNYNVAVKEYGDRIIFLRQIIEGGADQSYGIHVAKLAGLPESVIKRANEVLENLENNAIGNGGLPLLAKHGKEKNLKSKKDSRSDKKTSVKEETASEKEKTEIAGENFQPTLFDDL